MFSLLLAGCTRPQVAPPVVIVVEVADGDPFDTGIGDTSAAECALMGEWVVAGGWCGTFPLDNANGWPVLIETIAGSDGCALTFDGGDCVERIDLTHPSTQFTRWEGQTDSGCAETETRSLGTVESNVETYSVLLAFGESVPGFLSGCPLDVGIELIPSF